MRKKMLTISLAAIMMLSLAGCGNNNETNKTKTTAGTAATESDVATSGDVTEISDDEMFTDRDYDISYDEAEDVILADDASSSSSNGVSIDGNVITITKEGSYKFSGSLGNGQIVVDVSDDEKVQLVLDGVEIKNEDSAAIYVKNADKVFVTTTASENSLSVTGEFAENEDGIDAVIFAKDIIVFNGEGTLDIKCETSHGIVGKDNVKITSATYNIEAAKKGIDANDSVRSADGVINIVSGTDGIHVEKADDETEGFFYASGGTFNIKAGYDGIDASGALYVYGGDFNIISGGGSENGTAHAEGMPGGGFGGQRPDMENGQMPEGMTPPDMENGQDNSQNGGFGGGHGGHGQRPDMENGEMPEGMTPPDMENGEMPEGMTPPDMQNGEMPEGSDTEFDADDSSENSMKGIKADGGIYIYGGSLDIDSADDTLHSDSEIIIEDGAFTLASGDDGLHADVSLTVNGGSLEITKSYEGIESHTIEINDGKINITASDDGLNAGGSTDALLTINGGIINISAAGDCVDSNGTLAVNGGETYVSGPNNGGNGSIDYEKSGYITGGTFVSAGASGMAMNFGSESTQCSILYELSNSVESKTLITLTDSDGKEIISYTPDKAFQSIVISSPDIESSGTYTLTVGTESYTIEMSGNIYGQGMGAFGQGPMQGR